MGASARTSWIRAAILVGIGYFVVGRGFAVPTSHMLAWRYAAWVVSGVLFVAHLAYEHFRLRHAPRASASHAALAVAIGAFGLAVAGMIHSLSVGSARLPSWLLALVLWPVFTAVPAFLVAILALTVLARFPRRVAAGE